MTLLEQSVAPCWCGEPTCKIPYGLCHCKCGNKAPIHKLNVSTLGFVKGEPRKFILGHQRKIRLPIEDAAPFKIEGVYCRLIPLSAGFYAIVDEVDYRWLMEWKWTVTKARYTFYAYRLDWSVPKHPVWISMHRSILKLSAGEESEGDHKSGIGLDNRRNNLRPGTPQEQRCNMKVREDNKSGYPGVCEDEHGWRSVIGYKNKTIWLGRHATYEKAVEVRKAAERYYFGEWKRKP